MIQSNLNPERKYRIMLIDDTEVDCFISKKILNASNFASEISEYYSAQMALDFLEANKDNQSALPQIIFLDIHMPAMDGFDFMQKFVQLPINIKEYCKVIMLSSTLDPEDIKRITEYHQIFKFMTKPLTKEQMFSLNLELNATMGMKSK